MTSARDELIAWFRGRIPSGWFTSPVQARLDRDEVLVIGTLPEPDLGDDLDEDARRVALHARVQGWRDETREARMRIAREAEHRYGRRVAWGARCGEQEETFTTASVPVMTRLRMPERQVLDTLIDAGIARSRSEALAWCVRLVGRNQGEWIDQLRSAMEHVERVRDEGPEV